MIHTQAEDHEFGDIQRWAQMLERPGKNGEYPYYFHITPREWRVEKRKAGQVLHKVTHFEEVGRGAGGLSERELKALAHQNFKDAVNWAMEDRQKETRHLAERARIKDAMRRRGR